MDTETPPTKVDIGNQDHVTVLPDEKAEPGSEVEMDPDPPEDAAQLPSALQPQASGHGTIGPRSFDDIAAIPVVPKKLSVKISKIIIRVRFPRGFRPKSRLVLSHLTLALSLQDEAPGNGSLVLRLAGGSRLAVDEDSPLPNVVLQRQSDRRYVSSGVMVPLLMTSSVNMAQFKQVLTAGGKNQATAFVRVYAASKYLPRGSKISLAFGEVTANLAFH